MTVRPSPEPPSGAVQDNDSTSDAAPPGRHKSPAHGRDERQVMGESTPDWAGAGGDREMPDEDYAKYEPL